MKAKVFLYALAFVALSVIATTASALDGKANDGASLVEVHETQEIESLKGGRKGKKRRRKKASITKTVTRKKTVRRPSRRPSRRPPRRPSRRPLRRPPRRPSRRSGKRFVTRRGRNRGRGETLRFGKGVKKFRKRSRTKMRRGWLNRRTGRKGRRRRDRRTTKLLSRRSRNHRGNLKREKKQKLVTRFSRIINNLRRKRVKRDRGNDVDFDELTEDSIKSCDDLKPIVEKIEEEHPEASEDDVFEYASQEEGITKEDMKQLRQCIETILSEKKKGNDENNVGGRSCITGAGKNSVEGEYIIPITYRFPMDRGCKKKENIKRDSDNCVQQGVANTNIDDNERLIHFIDITMIERDEPEEGSSRYRYNCKNGEETGRSKFSREKGYKLFEEEEGTTLCELLKMPNVCEYVKKKEKLTYSANGCQEEDGDCPKEVDDDDKYGGADSRIQLTIYINEETDTMEYRVDVETGKDGKKGAAKEAEDRRKRKKRRRKLLHKGSAADC